MPGFSPHHKTLDNGPDCYEPQPKWRKKDPQDLGEFSFLAYFGMFFLKIAKERALAAFR
jgi:hypothetical protein